MANGQKAEWCRIQIVLILVLLLAASLSALGTIEFFVEYEARMRLLEREIQNRLSGTQPRNCLCSYMACGSSIEENITECHQHSQAEDLKCGFSSCSRMKISMSETYLQIPRVQSINDMSDALRRDICLTQGMASHFKTFRETGEGESKHSTFFAAAETGLYVSWPGTPGRRNDNSGRCVSYEPRLEPWWILATLQRRNVVILIDVSNSMNELIFRRGQIGWDLTMDMSRRLLDTFGEEDAFQIVTFNGGIENIAVDSRTSNSDQMVKATKENIQDVKKKLNRMEPTTDAVADIGEALERAFNLLDDNTVSGAGLCENHIILIAANRDCAYTASKNCTSKIYADLVNFESLNNASTVMLDFVENKLIYQQNSNLHRPVLFSYALHPHVNDVLSQVACLLSGAHIDVSKALSEGIVDPMQLLYAYAVRAGLPVADLFSGERKMVVSHDSETNDVTAVIPVFYQAANNCPSKLFGVIGAYIPEMALRSAGVETGPTSFRESVTSWNNDLNDCRIFNNSDDCQMQTLRQTQCVTSAETETGRYGAKCFFYDNSHYFINYTAGPAARFYGFGFENTKSNCKALGGEMVTPMDSEERRFLATIIPPDGVWVDAEQRGQFWFWPNGERVEGDVEIGRACETAFRAKFYMDPRSYEDNFYCTTQRALRTFICKFPGKEPPEICSDIENIRVKKGSSFDGTIESCGLEHCQFPTDHYQFLQPNQLICNRQLSDPVSYNEAACCNAADVNEFCVNSQTQENDRESENNTTAIVISVVIVGLIILFVATFCAIMCCVYGYSFTKIRQPVFKLSHSDGSQVNNLNTMQRDRRTDESIRSPFEAALTKVQRPIGKRPELVVNIEVKVLDNGWEKAGGYGRVRQGEYTDSHGQVHKVAVKFVDALAPTAAWEALRNEFEILSTIPLHPNIVRPIGAHWGDRSGQSERYIVEELMYTNLGDMIHKTEPLPFAGKTMVYGDWIKIYIDIASGLEHLHQNKIIHFDLKPRNVLLTEEMTAKIADFGCSKSKFDTYIELSAMAGTPPYLAPECWLSYYSQNSRAEVARAKIDIYSFGVIMWESLNGRAASQSLMTVPNEHPFSPPSSSKNPDYIQIKQEFRQTTSDEANRKNILHNLSEKIPVALRKLVSACVQFDFDSRPNCGYILVTLRGMLSEKWIDDPLP